MDAERLSEWAWVDRGRSDGAALRVVLAAVQLAVAALSASPQWDRRAARLSRTLASRVSRIEGGRPEHVYLRSARHGPIELEADADGLRSHDRLLRGMWLWADVVVEGPLTRESATAGMPRIADERPAIVNLGRERVAAIVELCDIALLCVMSDWSGVVDAWRQSSSA